MTPEQQHEEYVYKLKSIFMPLAYDTAMEMKRRKGKFAYYTSADTASKLIKNREIWMRNPFTMNDYSEIQYGHTNLLKALQVPERRERFSNFLNKCFEGLAADLAKEFDHCFDYAIREAAYITCLSEHAPPNASDESLYGRLSMWRAYGGTCGVALILKSDVIVGTGNSALGAYSSPVAYLDSAQMNLQFDRFLSSMEHSYDFIRTLDRDTLKRNVLIAMLFSILSTKHPGFSEEREWRVISCPGIFGDGKLETDIVSVRGTLQTIKKIPLRDDPSKKISGLALNSILDHIIIGPTNYPKVVKDSLVALLNDAGVGDASNKVVISDIPLRHAY